MYLRFFCIVAQQKQLRSQFGSSCCHMAERDAGSSSGAVGGSVSPTPVAAEHDQPAETKTDDVVPGTPTIVVRCASCGREGHKRRSSRLCPHYQRRQNRGQVRQEGFASGTNGRAGGNDSQGGEARWTLMDVSSEDLELVWYESFQARILDRKALDVIKSVTRNLRAQRITDDYNCASLFTFLMGTAMDELRETVNEGFRLSGADHTDVTTAELYVWFAHFLWQAKIGVGKDRCDQWLEAQAQKLLPPEIQPKTMSRERQRQITRHIRPFAPSRERVPATGSSWVDITDKTPLAREWVRKVLSRSIELLLVEGSHLTIDDWQSALRAMDIQVKHKSDRKAATWGFVADMVCDIFLRFVVDVRHKERGYSTAAAVDDIMRVNMSSLHRDISQFIFTADRGYVKEHLWKLLAKYRAGFVLICDPAHRTTGHPFIAATGKSAAKHDVAFRVPDGEKLGWRIYAATTSVQPQQGVNELAKPIYSYAVRTTKTVVQTVSHPSSSSNPNSGSSKKKNVKRSEVLRFFSSGTGMEDMLTRTYVATPKERGKLGDWRRTLWFPNSRINSQGVDPERRAVEQWLEQLDHVTPLTAAQRCACWFILRYFMVTGTMGAFMARRGPALGLLSSVAESRAALGTALPTAAATAGGTVPTPAPAPAPALARPVTPGYSDSDNDLGPDTSDSESNDESDGDADIEADRGDNGGENTNSNSSNVPSLYSNEDIGGSDEDMREVATRLISNWFGRHRSSDDMIKGTKNEKSVMDCLRNQPWAIRVWDVGLVAMKRYRWIGVSADGIIEFDSPQGHRVKATLEIKTKLAQQRINHAETIAAANGKYFECVAGDTTWFASVPWEYRGQVLHQATVFNVDHAVFVMAKTSGLIYSCLVKVLPDHRRRYLASLLRYERLFKWAYDEDTAVSKHTYIAMSLSTSL